MEKIVKPLLEWFETHQRELPWRKDRQPYHVWVSEIMLQQTRIEAVKKYYTRFMEEIPDIESLSFISEDRLLKLWEGLGYYSRAKNLKKTAQMIMEEYGGEFPHSYGEILKLSGIGEYTAGAIASVCFNEKVTAVDGNVLRVMARLSGSKENVLLPQTKEKFKKKLQKILPEQSGKFNEALMELGEMVCLPNGLPLCRECPLAKYCVSYRDGLTGEIPVRIKNIKRKKEEKTVLILCCQGKIAIEKRTAKGLLSGMYQFPNFEGFCTEEELKVKLQPLKILFLGKAKHTFTHIDWYMQGYFLEIAEPLKEYLWVTPQELTEQYALPTAFQPFWKKCHSLPEIFITINEQISDFS